MPIHFSIGFTLESSPKRAYVAACAGVADDVQVDAGYVNIVSVNACVASDIQINAVWPREDKCK